MGMVGEGHYRASDDYCSKGANLTPLTAVTATQVRGLEAWGRGIARWHARIGWTRNVVWDSGAKVLQAIRVHQPHGRVPLAAWGPVLRRRQPLPRLSRPRFSLCLGLIGRTPEMGVVVERQKGWR
jgi:hypothetical protein